MSWEPELEEKEWDKTLTIYLVERVFNSDKNKNEVEFGAVAVSKSVERIRSVISLCWRRESYHE